LLCRDSVGGSTGEPSTNLVFDCTDIIQQEPTLIALQWEYDWIDVVDMAMAVGIACDKIAAVTIVTGKLY
jgi:hypothetical protein